MRRPRENKRTRQLDNQWTFGKPNDRTGYMEIASVRVHRIVATAFHGEPPTAEHVVDHIDTNRQNNRPENLRWLTRLENILLNPVTAKRVIFVCGSIEAFLADPSKLRGSNSEPNFKWMRAVTPQEAQDSLKRMQAWAKSDKPSSGGSLGEWVYKRNDSQNQPHLVTALTPRAAQRNWRVLSEFPCCPQDAGEEPVAAYAEKLKSGNIFCHNNTYRSAVLKCALSHDRRKLWVLSESYDKEAVKPWALAEVTYENGLYVHTSLQSFFEEAGAEKQFCLAQGLEWTGGDSIDDYC
ncbi:HNH endonuclease signature motif containing protein [Treponema endosymbiont of Eucomonympha sp.]|uniref:HNH endonuclease signature motif containing protein n=1 Tax=Treponema endosymbiont of Eucomonympha sp. TaxID=1580831 RepID=UPI001E49ACEE|nr:HNH endonuclease signature motif containing protein [Treponema endosymbiont of Eucomonympha sp.]